MGKNKNIEFPNQNLRQIVQELLSYEQTYKQTDQHQNK